MIAQEAVHPYQLMISKLFMGCDNTGFIIIVFNNMKLRLKTVKVS